MRKLYCYVDESGQDTAGKIFIVSVVIAEGQRDELLSLCERIEAISRKGNHKWRAAKHEYRIDYLKQVFNLPEFKRVLHYSIFHNTQHYDLATIVAIAKAVNVRKPDETYADLCGWPD